MLYRATVNVCEWAASGAQRRAPSRTAAWRVMVSPDRGCPDATRSTCLAREHGQATDRGAGDNQTTTGMATTRETWHGRQDGRGSAHLRAHLTTSAPRQKRGGLRFLRTPERAWST